MLASTIVVGQLAAPAIAFAADGSTFVGESAPFDGAVVAPGSTFTKSWTIRNSGTTTWSTSGYRATRTAGSYGPSTISLPSSVSPGSNVTISASFTAPTTTGTHRATYRMTGPNGVFGTTFWVEIVVSSPTGTNGGVLGDDYPFKSVTPCTDLRPECVDDWGFFVRQCTSFVAWRMNNQYGIKFQNTMKGPNGKTHTWSDASKWEATAKDLGYRVDKIPTVGSIAYFASGHVALVAQVNANRIIIEEYNWGHPPYSYRTRTVKRSDVTSFLHVAR